MTSKAVVVAETPVLPPVTLKRNKDFPTNGNVYGGRFSLGDIKDFCLTAESLGYTDEDCVNFSNPRSAIGPEAIYFGKDVPRTVTVAAYSSVVQMRNTLIGVSGTLAILLMIILVML